jgi:hypothetical protein
MRSSIGAAIDGDHLEPSSPSCSSSLGVLLSCLLELSCLLISRGGSATKDRYMVLSKQKSHERQPFDTAVKHAMQ